MELRKRSLPQECAEKLSLEQFVALTEKLRWLKLIDAARISFKENL
jgi:hypothetical protein